MMATVPYVTSGWGLRKFQADGFLFDRVYIFPFLATCVSPISLSGYEAHLFTKEKHVTSRNARVRF